MHQAAPGEVRLEVRLLGQFAMAVDGRAVAEAPAGRLQSLLAWLLLHGGAPRSRAQLSFTFWPDVPEANARNNLRQLLHQLRQALPGSERFLRADAQTVQWAADAPLDLDVARFEAALAESEAAGRAGDATRRRVCLERALDLCQGPLLPSCYDDWIGPERDRLARRCEEAAAALVPLLEAEREYAAAVRRVRHWLQHDPLDEEAYRWLMRLLALAGDRAAALQAYRQCAEVLERELGAQPSAATRRVHEGIRGTEAAAPPETAAAASRADATVPLVGRQREWSRLRAAWERAAQGHVGFAVVTGDAGIGKSRLAEELLIWARRQGVSSASTRSYAAEGSLSLAPVTEWLRSDALAGQLARLEDVWHLEIARLLPELLAARPALPRPAPITDFGDRLRFFEGLVRAVLLAPPPLLLLIDDLQWCDRETIEWLHFLSRFEPGAALLVLGTARSEQPDPGHPLPELLRDLRSRSQLVEIALEPLDAAETAALAGAVAERAIDDEAATRLYRETEGNPLFVVETIRGEDAGDPRREETGPTSSGLSSRAQAVIAGRLAQLSEPARQVAAAAAVIGRAFGLDVLARVVGDEDAAVATLDELWRRRIVREQAPNLYDFTHDRLREVAYAETSVPQRRRLHRRVAEALLALHPGDLDPVSASLAAHYESAGMAGAALPHYARAAAVAQGVYAHEEATALAERALALLGTLPPSAARDGQELELHLALAPSCRVTKGWAAPELGVLLDRAKALCDRVGTPAQRVQVLYGVQSFSVVAARLEKSALVAEELERGSLVDGTPPGRLQPAFAMMAGVRIQMGRFQEACQDIDRLLGELDREQLQRFHRSQGVNYEVHAWAWQSHALWCLGRPDTALARASHALQLARQVGQPFSQAIAATYLALLQQLRGEPQGFRAQAGEALELATQFKANYYRACAAILMAHAEAPARPGPGDVARLRAAIDGFQQTGARLRLPYYLALLAELQLRAGACEAGLEVAEAALAASRETSERWWDAELHRLRAELLLAGGAGPGEAEAALRRALAIARSQQARSLELRAARTLARLLGEAGRVDEARELLVAVLSCFTEGRGTRDLQQAHELLAGLG